MAASSFPRVLDALLTAVRAVPSSNALYQVQLFDGPATGDYEPDYLTIGWSTVASSTSIQTFQDTFDGALAERYEIPVSIRSWSGDDDVKPRRDRVFAISDALEAVCDALTVTGVDLTCRIQPTSYDPWQSSEGCQVMLSIRIAIDAYL